MRLFVSEHDGQMRKDSAYSDDIKSFKLKSTSARLLGFGMEDNEPDANRDEDYNLEDCVQVPVGKGVVDEEVVEIAALDVAQTRQAEDLLVREKKTSDNSFYSNLIFTLTSLRYPEQQAQVHWRNLLEHKWMMSRCVGRNVGIRVSALDYFRNIVGALDDVKIINSSAFMETEKLALTDGLTGLYNHRCFHERLKRDMQRAAENAQSLCLLMIDLDHFKICNDVGGHLVGDEVLKAVAATLLQHLKKSDFVARYGGDEFAVILLGLNQAQGQNVAERICASVSGKKFSNGEVLPHGKLTVSIGVAAYPEDAQTCGDLIARSDQALYAAKHQGRNRIGVASKDPRIDLRRKAEGSVAYQLSGVDGDEFVAELVNVSGGGLCLDCEQPLMIGQILRLKLPHWPQGEKVYGRSVWRKVQTGGRVRVGIKLVNLNGELRRFVENETTS
jgi:diguanylate cyclase (GGDEF)-like protein